MHEKSLPMTVGRLFIFIIIYAETNKLSFDMKNADAIYGEP